MISLGDLRDIDLNDPSSWPSWFSIFLALILCGGIIYAGYHFIIQDQIAQLERLERQEQSLKKTFLDKKALAVNLPAYRAQLKEMEETFGVMVEQLPDKTEIPDLLVDITQAGLGRGLNFVQFDPDRERKGGFYAALPIKMVVTGTYHQIAEFVSDLAALPRIVTVGNLVLSPAGGGNNLRMTATLNTYRYLEE